MGFEQSVDNPGLKPGMYRNQYGMVLLVTEKRRKLYLHRNVCPVDGTIWTCWSVLQPVKPVDEGYCGEACYEEEMRTPEKSGEVSCQ